jgi:hypothetical protein
LGDNYLVQVQSKGVNATSIDMPNYDGSGYKVNHNPRNGKSYFNTAAFTPNAFGTQGNSKRRMFYGPGIDNYDMALHKVTSFTEGRSLELRLEMFNVFNHAQFYPNGSVDGNIGDASFGRVLRAADPPESVKNRSKVPLLRPLGGAAARLPYSLENRGGE